MDNPQDEMKCPPPFAAPAGQHDAKSWNAALVAAEKAIRERACGDEIFVENAAEELVLLRRTDEQTEGRNE